MEPAVTVKLRSRVQRTSVNRRPVEDTIHNPSARDRFDRAILKSRLLQFKHAPIDPKTQVRLLLFSKQPNNRSYNRDDIFISLLVVPFEDLGTKYPYEALSYHWGHDEATYPIYFLDSNNSGAQFTSLSDIVKLKMTERRSGSIFDPDDEDTSKLAHKRLYVRKNLYFALKHLQGQVEEGELNALWVDAICINQGDNEEKMEQVLRMAEIYSKAQRVCIWLGPGTSQTDAAMDFIVTIMKAEFPEDLMQDGKFAKNWNNLVNLMSKPWFSRRWVIQELALAQDATVHCGSKEVHWGDFSDAISLLGLHVDEIRDLLQKWPGPDFENNYWIMGDIDLFGASVLVKLIPNVFRKLGNNRASIEPALGLETLVSSYAMFDSADPRDTIMAMRNIAKETFFGSQHQTRSREPPSLDYKKDLFEVYADFIDWVVDTTHSLDILCRFWARPERKQEDFRPPTYPSLVTLPSWILETPRQSLDSINIAPRLRGDSFVGLPGFANYNASDGRPPVVRLGQYQRRPQGKDLTISNKDLAREPTKSLTGIGHNSLETRGRKRLPESIADPATLPQEHKRFKATQILATQTQLPGSQVAYDDARVESSQTSLSRPETTEIPVSTGGRKQAASLDKSLYVKGFRMDKITWRSDPIPDGVIPRLALEKCGWNQDKPPENIDKLLRTLVADRGPEGRLPTWYDRACLRCLSEHTPNGHLNTRQLLSIKQPKYIKQFLQRVQAVTWDRVFLETNSEPSSPLREQDRPARDVTSPERCLGLGPANTRQGDIVCILFGCSVPVILREIKNEDNGHCFKFIGEAFIYGKMDGEAISTLGLNELENKTEEFRLI